MGIDAGIPNAIIRAILNSREAIGAFPQQSIQSAAMFSAQDFARIGRADRRDGIRSADPGFEKGHAAIEFQMFEIDR